MKRRAPGWVQRELAAAYQAGRLATLFSQRSPGEPSRAAPDYAEQFSRRRPGTEEDGWHH